MNFRQIVQDYFTFSRNERKGVTILVVIIFLLAIANKTIFYFETPAVIDTKLLNAELNLEDIPMDKNVNQPEKLFAFNPNTIDRLALDSLSLPEGVKKNMLKYREKGGKYYSAKDFRKIYGITDSVYNKIEPYIFIPLENGKDKTALVSTTKKLFDFDPNTASDSIFLCLGITDNQIKTIRNYQKKGGSFYDSADFLKIYGLTASQKRELVKFVEIENVSFKKEAEIPITFIEINSTDSVELKKLPGIGNKLSKRIIKYRDLLGGFYNSEQLKEVYGLNEKTIQRINGRVKVDVSKIQKVDLNFSDGFELARHPYIGKDLAEKIIKFRTSYGSISNSSILKDSLILNFGEYERLKPYL